MHFKVIDGLGVSFKDAQPLKDIKRLIAYLFDERLKIESTIKTIDMTIKT